MIVGESVTKNIRILQNKINNSERFNPQPFYDSCESLKEVVNSSKSHGHWSSLFAHQESEILKVLTDLNSSCANEESEAEESTSPVVTMKGMNKFIYFEPLVDYNLRIKCSQGSCSSSFLYKRSYVSHMKRFHSNLPIEKVRDPVGTCRLIRYRCKQMFITSTEVIKSVAFDFSTFTKKPCMAKLPYSREGYIRNSTNL